MLAILQALCDSICSGQKGPGWQPKKPENKKMIASTKTEIEVKRPNGQIEIVTNAIPFSQEILNKAFTETKKAGRGEILSLTLTEVIYETNLAQLKKNYNNLQNEGGEGYMPDDDYFKSSPNFKSSEKTVVKKLVPKC